MQAATDYPFGELFYFPPAGGAQQYFANGISFTNGQIKRQMKYNIALPYQRECHPRLSVGMLMGEQEGGLLQTRDGREETVGEAARDKESDGECTQTRQNKTKKRKKTDMTLHYNKHKHVS